MTKHIRVTIEVDDLAEPLVFESDVESYRVNMDTDYAKLDYAGTTHYARAGNALSVDWRINPVWDFEK